VTFEIGLYQLPKDTIITVSQYITHRLPQLYPQPQAFKPERWETIDPTPYEYFPFGAGPRMCIGATFAMMEAKIVLAMLLQRYRLAVVPGARIDHQIRITLAPKNGLPVTIARRSTQAKPAPVRGNIHAMVDLP